MTNPRNTTIRNKHRRIIAKSKPPCALCGMPIDYNLNYPDPWSYVVDHVQPIAQGGTDTINNKQAAHRHCNRMKSDKLDGGPILKRTTRLNRT